MFSFFNPFSFQCPQLYVNSFPQTSNFFINQTAPPIQKSLTNTSNIELNHPSVPSMPCIKEEETGKSIKQSNKKVIAWSEMEDYFLYQIISCKYPETYKYNNGKNLKIKWSKIASELNLFLQKYKKPRKLGKHCRERWINHLNPKMNKGQWTNDEDIKLIQCYAKYVKKWASIALELPKRSQHSIKNRFYHLMAKHLNVTNREVIKSKNLFREEAVCLLEKMHLNEKEKIEKIKNLNIQQTNHLVKTEHIESERPHQISNLVSYGQEFNYNMNNFQNYYNNGFRLMPKNNNFLMNFNKISNIPFNSFNFWPNNFNNIKH